MASPETSHHSEEPTTKIELLIELAVLDELIQPYLETSLGIDEKQKLDNLLEHKDWIMADIQKGK